MMMLILIMVILKSMGKSLGNLGLRLLRGSMGRLEPGRLVRGVGDPRPVCCCRLVGIWGISMASIS